MDDSIRVTLRSPLLHCHNQLQVECVHREIPANKCLVIPSLERLRGWLSNKQVLAVCRKFCASFIFNLFE